MPINELHGVEVIEVDDGIRPIKTAASSVMFDCGTAPDADAEVFPINEPVLITGPRMAALLGDAGTLKDSYLARYASGNSTMIVNRVEEGADEIATKVNVAGDPTQQTGVYAALIAKAQTGLEPMILTASGHTKPAGTSEKDVVASALQTVAERLRATAYIEGPNTTEADVINYAGNFSSDRLQIVDPYVRVVDTVTGETVTVPGSAFVAGVQSATDRERGFWWSASNQEAKGIVGTARPISHKNGDTETEANRLTRHHGIATFVRDKGWRVWGNRSTSDDPLWAFLSVRRTADMVYRSVEDIRHWILARPYSPQLIIDGRESLQAYLDRLTAGGALRGGSVWIDPELNTEADLRAGRFFYDLDIEPTAPAEHIVIRAHRNGTYWEEFISQVAA